MKNNSSRVERERQLAQKIHDLMVKNKIEVNVRESDPDAGSTTIRLQIPGDRARTIALVDYSESLVRNTF